LDWPFLILHERLARQHETALPSHAEISPFGGLRGLGVRGEVL